MRGSRPWLGLAVLLLPTMLMTADLGVLWLATPYLVADLQPTSSELLWITDIYGFMTAGFLIIMGTLGDRVGRRRLLMAGSALFVVASVLAAYAGSAEMLIAARALLGVAGAAVLPSTLALITHMFVDPRQRTTAIAMWVAALSLGLGLGPVIGGLLLADLHWGSVFLIGVPVMVLALVTAPILLPEYRDPKAGRLDPLSVVLFLLGVLPVVYAIKRTAEVGAAPEALVSAAFGVGFAFAFVARQRGLDDPLIDLNLFRDRTFRAAQGTLILGMIALNGVEYLVPQFMLLVGGITPIEAALWLLPGAAGLLIGSPLIPLAVRVLRPAYVIAIGQVVVVAGLALIFMAASDGPSVLLSAIGLAAMLLGVAPISVLCTQIALGSAPAERAGMAAGVGQTSYDLGLALGIAITGSAAVAVYRREVAGDLPSGVPTGVGDSVRDTLGGATSTADQLPEPLASNLLAVAREAFSAGVQTAAAISCIVAGAAAALVILRLRHIPTTGRAAQPRSRATGSTGAMETR